MAYGTKATLRDPSVAEAMNFETESQQSPELQQYFTLWSLDNVPDVGGDWNVTEENIKRALVKRLQEKIEEWEIQNNVFAESRTLLTQSLLRYFK